MMGQEPLMGLFQNHAKNRPRMSPPERRGASRMRSYRVTSDDELWQNQHFSIRCSVCSDLVHVFRWMLLCSFFQGSC